MLNRITTSYARHIGLVKRESVRGRNWLGVIVTACLDVVLIVNIAVRY